MKLSPLEIKKQEFARAFRGYDVEEVQAFLQMVSSQWETLLEENRRLEEQVRDYKNKIEHYEKVEEALQDALETARETAKEKVENAEQRAENIIDEAEQKAEKIRDEAQTDRYSMRREVSKLKHRREEIVARLRAFLMSEMEMLAQYEDEDPIGFIKFLPQQGEGEGRDEDLEEPVEGGPRRAGLTDGPEAPQRKRPATDRNGPEGGAEAPDPPSANATGRRESEQSLSRVSGGQRTAGGEQPVDESSPSDRDEGKEEEQPPEKQQRWRVHSVVSSPPGSKDPSEKRPQKADAASSSEERSAQDQSERQSGQQKEDAASSEEMDKIRRILDELE